MSHTIVRKLFDAWESLFHKVFRLQEIQPGEEHLFYISKRRYIGKPFTVDGVFVRLFDPVVELHFNNDIIERALHSDPNVVRAMVQLLREARKTMPLLASALQGHRYRDAKALYGITFIHRGIERFGFQTLPMPGTLSRRLTSWHLTNLLKMLNPDADHILETHKDVLVPKLVVASKQHIIEQFAEGAEGTQIDSSKSSSASSSFDNQKYMLHI